MWTAISAIVAIYAAVISTWLFVDRLLEGNPIFILEPTSERRTSTGFWLRLRIRNPGKRPILVEKIVPHQPSPAAEKVAIFEALLDGVELRHVINYAITQEINLFITPNKEATIGLLIDDDGANLQMSILWQKHSARIMGTKTTKIVRTNSQLKRIYANVTNQEPAGDLVERGPALLALATQSANARPRRDVSARPAPCSNAGRYG